MATFNSVSNQDLRTTASPTFVTVTGNLNGNAATVTNGVYTTGTQTVGGQKTFTGPIYFGLGLASDLISQNSASGQLWIGNGGSNTANNALLLSSDNGGVTLGAAANKDIVLTTSGTGKTSAVNLTVTNPIVGSVTGSAGSVSASALTGSTLNSGVTASSLTSFGVSPTLTTPNIGAATGTSLSLGTGLIVGTSTGFSGVTFKTTDGFSQTLINVNSYSPGVNTAVFLPEVSNDILLSRTSIDTLTNKSISGSTNTLSNIANASLTNSAVTINGTSISLGASGTVAAAAGTLTGSTLASGVTASSLTSVGPLTGLTVSPSGAVAAPTATTTVNARTTAAYRANIVLSGTAYNASTDTNGIVLGLNNNSAGNRQLSITDSAALSSSATQSQLRIIPQGSSTGVVLESLGTNGSTPLPLSLNGAGGVVNVGTGGVSLANGTSGYTPTALNYNENTTTSMTVGGAWAQTVTLKLSRVGNQVMISYPDMSTGSASASVLSSSAGVVPARFRPASTQNFVVWGQNGGTIQAIEVSLTSAGTLTWNNMSGGAFTAGSAAAAWGVTLPYTV